MANERIRLSLFNDQHYENNSNLRELDESSLNDDPDIIHVLESEIIENDNNLASPGIPDNKTTFINVMESESKNMMIENQEVKMKEGIQSISQDISLRELNNSAQNEDEDPDIIHVLEAEIIENELEVEESIENIVSVTTENNLDPSLKPDDEPTFKIIRKTAVNDYMFYRIPIQNETNQIESECFPFIDLEILTKCIKEYALKFWLLIIPNLLFSLYVFITFIDSPCNNDKFLLNLGRLIGTYNIAIYILLFSLVLLNK